MVAPHRLLCVLVYNLRWVKRGFGSESSDHFSAGAIEIVEVLW